MNSFSLLFLSPISALFFCKYSMTEWKWSSFVRPISNDNPLEGSILRWYIKELCIIEVKSSPDNKGAIASIIFIRKRGLEWF